MLTENDARTLLAQAADTIEVGPATPVEPVRRRAWPVLTAAAATLVAGLGVWAGVAALDTEAAPEPSVDSGPVEPGTMPSVFGHRRAEATRLLEQSGLEVRVVERPSCDLPGQAVDTLPSTGSRLQPGSTVTLQVAGRGVSMDCAGELDVPWQLLGLATGELESPSLLQGPLTTYLDGERRVVRDASDPAAWGSPSALEALRAGVDWSPDVPRGWRTLEAQEPGCDGAAFVPNVIAGTTLQRYAIEYDDPDAPCVQLTVAGEFGKRPVEVAVETAGLEVGDPDPAPDPDAATVPAVFGLTEGEALEVLRDAGVGNLVTEAEPGCYASGRALSTQPGSGARLDATSTVRLLVTAPQDGVCLPSTEGEGLFWELVALSRGRDTTMLAPTVTAWLDGKKSLVTNPGARGSWGAGSVLDAVEAVVDAPDPAGPVRRIFRLVSPEQVVQPCSVDGQLASLPGEATGLGPGDRPGSSAWFAYQVGGVDRACVLVDILTDPRGRLAKVVVRTQDPDGLLPDGATGLVVTEGVVGPPLRVPPEPGQQVTIEALLAFARGESDTPPPLAPTVTLLDRGERVRDVRADLLGDREAWLVCDESADDTCGVSALQILGYAVKAPVGDTYPRAFGRSPTPQGGESLLVLGPTRVTSCQPRGLVGLMLDADDVITSVDVAGDASPQLCSDEGLAPPE